MLIRQNETHMWLPRWCSGQESTFQCRRLKRCGFDPCVRRDPYPKWRFVNKFWEKKKKKTLENQDIHGGEQRWPSLTWNLRKSTDLHWTLFSFIKSIFSHTYKIKCHKNIVIIGDCSHMCSEKKKYRLKSWVWQRS